MEIIIEEKKCPGCQKIKPLEEFCSKYSYYKGHRYRYRIRCKKCLAKKTKVYYQKNKEKWEKYNQKSHLTRKKFRQENKEKINLRQKKFRQENKNYVLKQAGVYRQKNRRKTRERARREIETLGNVYMKYHIRKNDGTNIIRKYNIEIPQKLIKAKRAHLQAFRLLQLVKKGVAI